MEQAKFGILLFFSIILSQPIFSQIREIDKNLLKAVEEKNIQETENLINKGANVNIKDYNSGDTPLHIAVRKGAIEIVKILLKKGANINAKDNEGYAPIHSAVLWKNKDMILLLIKYKCNINARGEFNYTPLHFIAKRDNIELATLLIENGANVNDKEGEYGFSPLRLSLDDNIYSIQSYEMAKYFIENGADINSKDNRGETLLHSAIISGNLKTINFLIKNGADLNLKVSEGTHKYAGNSPVQIAIKEKRQDIVKLLIKNGAK